MLNSKDRILVAVSGGMDSMCLLHNLLSLKDDYELDICVCHLNHGIRNTANRDEEFVKSYCINRGIKVYTKKVNMNQYASENKLSSEEAGRKLRYDFFNEISKGERKIFLAHNANDQAETVLFRIIRGTGIDGLNAMKYVSGNLFRPILNIKRLEIEKYIEDNNVEFVQDETNYEDIYSRNKLRLNLIPYVEENFNKNFIDALIRLSDISSDNQNYINTIVKDYIKENYENNILNIGKLRESHKYICNEVIREFLNISLGSLEGISKVNIEDINNMIMSSTASKITVNKGLVIELSYNSLYVNKDFKDEDFIEVFLNEGINNTKLGIFNLSKEQYYGNKPFISIDFDKVKGKIKVRNKIDGDKFTPLGMKKYKKLKNFFVDEKIERYVRKKIPIICDDEEIIWVCPYRMSDKYKVNRETNNIINIILEDKND